MFRHQQYRGPNAQLFGASPRHRKHDERFREVSVMIRDAAVAYGESRLRIGVKEHVIADPHRVEPQLLAFAREVSGVRRGVIDTLVDHRNANFHICSSLGNLHRCSAYCHYRTSSVDVESFWRCSKPVQNVSVELPAGPRDCGPVLSEMASSGPLRP